MESTPPESRTRTKSASRLSKLRHYSGSPIPPLSLEIVPCSPKISTPSPASTISPTPRPPYTLPLHELLLLSPSPLKRSKTRRLENADDVAAAAVEAFGVRKRCKSRNSASGCAASPRSSRRSRRRTELERDQEKDIVAAGEEIVVKPRKKRHIDKSRKDDKSPRTNDGGDVCNLNAIGEVLSDIVMWKDVSKSSFWFGFGSLCFLSSCFTKGVNFSIFSFLSQAGLLLLGVAFFSNSMRPKDATAVNRDFTLKEDDILRVARLILPAANLAISKTRQVFSGEPAMTLKVVPVLLVGAEYGHLINLWRLCALGFFISFTVPKLYSAYSSQLSKKVEYVKSWALDAWRSCTYKKIAAGSAVTAFWNLTSIRTRVFAAFMCLVILRYRRQHSEADVEEEDVVAGGSDVAQQGCAAAHS